MRVLTYLPLFLLAAATSASPTSKEDSLVVTRQFFIDSNAKYTGQHDIVNVIVPLNKINFEDDDDNKTGDDSEEVTIFFVEADVNDKKERKDQGLYVLKNGKATKILDNGRDATALHDDSNRVYLGASDGVYVYDNINATIYKYGSLTDNIIQIEADNRTGRIYFVTNDHQVFSIADEGRKKNKVDDIDDVQEIAFDYNSTLYYYDTKNDLYVYNKNGIKKIEGIPTRNEIKLVRPMFAQESGVFAVIDNKLYLLNADGTAEKSKVMFEVKPTAYAPEATLIQYYAFDRKIYEFNAIKIIASELIALKEFLDSKRNEIQSIATKSRRNFGA